MMTSDPLEPQCTGQPPSLVGRLLGQVRRAFRRVRARSFVSKRTASARVSDCPARRLIGDRRFRHMLENLPSVAVQGYDRHRRVVYWNEASTRLYGYRQEEALGRRLEELLIPEPMQAEVIRAHRAWIEEGIAIPPGPLVLRQRSGAPVAVYSYHVMLGRDGDEPLMFCIDAEQQSLPAVQGEYALVEGFEALGRLPDQARFESMLGDAMRRCSSEAGDLALLAVDIDPGTDIDEAGRVALMAMVAQCLEEVWRQGPLAQDGPGRFMLLATGLHGEHAVPDRAEAILRALEAPVITRQWHLVASIGICQFPEHDVTPGELMQRAALAAHRARRAGPDRYWIFDQRLHAALQRQHRLVAELRRSLDEGEFVLRYRPRIAPQSQDVEGLETWLHWQPRHGESRPPFQVSSADAQAQLLARLGDWVLLESCIGGGRGGAIARREAELDFRAVDARVALGELLRQVETGQSQASDTSEGASNPGRGDVLAALRNGRNYTIRLEADPPTASTEPISGDYATLR